MMSSEKTPAYSPWSNISSSTWPAPASNQTSHSNTWKYASKDHFVSPRFTYSSEPPPTMDTKNSYPFETAPPSPTWNTDGVDQFACKLLTISDDSLVEPIIPNATPWLSPITAEPSPTMDTNNSFAFETAPISPTLNMDEVDRLAAKLLTIEEDNLVEPIIPTSTPWLSPNTVEPSPTMDTKNSFAFETAPLSPPWNMDGVDQLAAQLLKIEEDRLVEPILPISKPRRSPITVEGDYHIQAPTSRSSTDISIDKDEQSGDSSDPEGPSGPNSRFKTEICRNFQEKGRCLYGDLCQFAHGNNEMRNVGQHNRYKTKRCQKYWIAGYCPYGPRCNFLHNEERDQIQPKHKHSQTIQAQNLQNQRRIAGIRKGSTGEFSGESNSTTPSCSPPNIEFKLPTLPIALEVLHRPSFGSGRLAAYTRDGEFFWIDTRTQKYTQKCV